MASSLMRTSTPEAWTSLLQASNTDDEVDPQQFLRKATQNTMAVDGWRMKAQNGALLGGKEPLRLASLFNPSTFLNALRQLTSRKGIMLFAVVCCLLLFPVCCVCW